MTKRLILLTAGLIALSVALLPTDTVKALSGSDFSAGRIIDDGVYFNKNSMSAADIQAFMNIKLPACDVWGQQMRGNVKRADYGAAQGNPAPYTCLKDYRQDTPSRNAESGLCNAYTGGTKSSAQIIYDVAQSCGVNPKVLLVVLQKEQSLLTDDWPWAIQYRAATGYGCPDTAPCDAEYYGFFNQVYNAARQSKKYARDQTLFRYRAGRDNFVQYNPVASCGGGNVYIQNQATAGLYNYTPYQPNAAALNNLMGTGDNCSAYGNRNFWRLFSEWFGNTRYSFGVRPSAQSSYATQPCTIETFDNTMVARLINPDVQDYLYTTSYAEACAAVSYGYIMDGTVMRSVASNATGAIPVYRIANYERHVFTTDITLRNNYVNNYGYKDEGIGFYAYNSPASDRTAVSGLQGGNTFFLTSSGKEAEIYQNNHGYYNFGTVFYTPTLSTGPTPVLRMSRDHQRLYTLSTAEQASATSKYGFVAEGNTAQAERWPTAANAPVFRLRSPTGAYFYTRDRFERDLAVINYGYYSEGISFYALLWSDTPIYRAANPYTANRIYTDSATEYNRAQSLYSFIGEYIGWYGYR